MPKIGFKAPSKAGIEATGTGFTVVLTKIRQWFHARKA